MALEPDAVEIRVVGCLIEKQRTTPDAYPLSLNALRLACNQSTNRDPVVDYDEATVSEALRRLALRGWTRLASGAGSRARKYRHLLPEAIGVDEEEISLLAVLMLRGAQTPGELKQRAERLHGFADLAAVEGALERLIGRGFVARLERRPGQKEERYAQLLGGGEEEGASPAAGRCCRRRRPRRPSPSAVARPPPKRTGSTGSNASSPSCAAELARLREALGELPARAQPLFSTPRTLTRRPPGTAAIR